MGAGGAGNGDRNIADVAMIEFSKPMNEDEIHGLFNYAASTLDSRFQYEVCEEFYLDPTDTEEDSIVRRSEGITLGDKCSVIPGKPYIHMKRSPSMGFRGHKVLDDDDIYLVGGIRFETTPGYSLAEHFEGDIKFMDDFRRAVVGYEAIVRPLELASPANSKS